MLPLPSWRAAGLAFALVASVQAANYEVAQLNPRADDAAPGTLERPWKTLAKAAGTVRPGDMVVIRGGIYRERVVLKTSGTAQVPIRFVAAPGERVVVTGADRLTGWRRADDGATDLPRALAVPVHHLEPQPGPPRRCVSPPDRPL